MKHAADRAGLRRLTAHPPDLPPPTSSLPAPRPLRILTRLRSWNSCKLDAVVTLIDRHSRLDAINQDVPVLYLVRLDFRVCNARSLARDLLRWKNWPIDSSFSAKPVYNQSDPSHPLRSPLNPHILTSSQPPPAPPSPPPTPSPLPLPPPTPTQSSSYSQRIEQPSHPSTQCPSRTSSRSC